MFIHYGYASRSPYLNENGINIKIASGQKNGRRSSTKFAKNRRTALSHCRSENSVVLLGELVVRQELLEVSGQQFLLHGESHPGPGLPHVRLDLTDVLNVPERSKRVV